MIAEPEHLVSSAQAYFFIDQPHAALGFDRDVAEQLGKQLDFAEVGSATRSDQAQVWIARRGKLKRKQGSAISIQSAQGHELDLFVEVLGTSSQADEALGAVWACLTGSSGPALESVATVRYRTLTVMKLPRAFDELFPLARRLREDVVARLERNGESPSRAPLAKFSIEIVTTLGGRSLNRTLTFEPRATAPVEQRVYYVSSPLRSDEHLALIASVLAER